MESKNALLGVALVGYGAMGKEIEGLSARYGCAVRQIFTSKRSLANASPEEWNFEVALDFSRPEAVRENARLLAAERKNVVIGATGWAKDKEAIAATLEEAGAGAVYASNFSVGVQMFFRLARRAAELAENYDEYDAALHELHHRRKLDAPSGTALTLASIVTGVLGRKTVALSDAPQGKIPPEALHVTSTRVGDVPGTHTLYLDSAADTIELTHRARGRGGFAAGALRAARWIAGKKGFYDFTDIFDNLSESQP